MLFERAREVACVLVRGGFGPSEVLASNVPSTEPDEGEGKDAEYQVSVKPGVPDLTFYG